MENQRLDAIIGTMFTGIENLRPAYMQNEEDKNIAKT
jgi:hypothetical protein